MTLQNDLLEIYNSLVSFSDETLKSNHPIPITVFFEKSSNLLVFEQRGRSVRLYIPIYYSLALDEIQEKTYLLPKDYDYLMSNLQYLINSGVLMKERTILSPENYGFDVYGVNLKELWKGPDVVGRIRFISGKSRFFKFKVRLRWNLKAQ